VRSAERVEHPAAGRDLAAGRTAPAHAGPLAPEKCVKFALFIAGHPNFEFNSRFRVEGVQSFELNSRFRVEGVRNFELNSNFQRVRV
jgi:hypothetical protein